MSGYTHSEIDAVDMLLSLNNSNEISVNHSCENMSIRHASIFLKCGIMNCKIYPGYMAVIRDSILTQDIRNDQMFIIVDFYNLTYYNDDLVYNEVYIAHSPFKSGNNIIFNIIPSPVFRYYYRKINGYIIDHTYHMRHILSTLRSFNIV